MGYSITQIINRLSNAKGNKPHLKAAQLNQIIVWLEELRDRKHAEKYNFAKNMSILEVLKTLNPIQMKVVEFLVWDETRIAIREYSKKFYKKPQGYWIISEIDDPSYGDNIRFDYKCSACETYFEAYNGSTNFCPHCGARMGVKKIW